MGKINVLSFEIANLIAAGEVVERPSSVMKELIENSIDSGAHIIVAEIKHGGVALIRVSDDGCGMTAEDLPVSLRRHATSKIHTRDDLSGITTLGFRGEALAAISSVSKVTIISKTREEETGHMLSSEGGNILDISEVGAADGTTVVVEDLFFNVPARRKFLKKDATEALNVAAIVERVALSRPDISVSFSVDGALRFRTLGDGELLSAIRAVYGADFAAKMLPADGRANGVHVTGFIGRSDNIKKNRNGENVFINGRYVKSLTAQAAIEKAYTSYIETESFPVCVLSLELDPMLVDVNVHPSKLEVKFSDERAVFEAVYYTVKSTLEKAEYRPDITLKPRRDPLATFLPIGADTKGEQVKMPAPAASQPSRESTPWQSEPRVSVPPRGLSGADAPRAGRAEGGDFQLRSPVGGTAQQTPARQRGEEMSPSASLELLRKYDSARAEYPAAPQTQHRTAENTATADTPAHAVSATAAPAGEEHSETVAEPAPTEYRYVGEAFDCYVIIEYQGDLLLIDKHAAHERIIFEELKASRARDHRVASQALLIPSEVTLTAEEMSAAVDFCDDLRSVGFEFSLSDRIAKITAIPDAISTQDAEGLFVTMCDEMAGGRGTAASTESLRRERALYQVACKAAIKGGRHYDISVIQWLITKLLSIPDITVCPHGRPVAYRIRKNELDRWFDRLR